MPLVGGDRGQPEQAHDRAEQDRGHRRDRERDEGEHGGGAAEIDEREDVALGHEIAEPAGGERADDVEQPDHGDGPAADLGGKAFVHQIGRHVHGDECELETAGEEAEHQQHVGSVTRALPTVPAAAIGSARRALLRLRRAPSRSQPTAAAPSACRHRRPPARSASRTHPSARPRAENRETGRTSPPPCRRRRRANASAPAGACRKRRAQRRTNSRRGRSR